MSHENIEFTITQNYTLTTKKFHTICQRSFKIKTTTDLHSGRTTTERPAGRMHVLYAFRAGTSDLAARSSNINQIRVLCILDL